MVDRAFYDNSLAELYDALNPWGPGDEFYLDLVMDASAVLDVGCGTGRLLSRARRAGHGGRLAGLDPARAMLDQAPAEADVEWVLGDLNSMEPHGEFDLIVMTGHAFQVLVEDEELLFSLTAIRSALTDDGRFVFETRNPLVRPWESWTPENAVEVADTTGTVVRVWHEVGTPVTEDVVHFTETYSSPRWDRPRVSHSSLRFLDANSLVSFLSRAGLAVEEQFGDWARQELTGTSPEIITLAGRR
ncbi:MAG TPA: class I SAM-dependent methyltransferase [Streptomyces sp.]|nr:class I SAM-dependent methyltransferase [Streptomyces sp.]